MGEESVVMCYTLTVKPAASALLFLPSLSLFVASEASDSWCTHWLLRRSSLISGMEVAMAVASVWRDARTRHWSVHVQEFHPPLMTRYHSSATSSHASQWACEEEEGEEEEVVVVVVVMLGWSWWWSDMLMSGDSLSTLRRRCPILSHTAAQGTSLQWEVILSIPEY